MGRLYWLFWSAGGDFFLSSKHYVTSKFSHFTQKSHRICTYIHTEDCFLTEQVTHGSQMRKFNFIV